MHVDPEAVRQRAEREDQFGPSMPAEAVLWAEIADELDLVAALARHIDRIPKDIAERVQAELKPFEIPASAPDTGNWRPLTSEVLETLLPPARE
jgi:hypothetical protein